MDRKCDLDLFPSEKVLNGLHDGVGLLSRLWVTPQQH